MHRLVLSLALGAVGAASPSHAALPRALDGSWYNPLQSGHGLTIERIDHDSALLFWHVFDPAGKPLTLYAETQIEGDGMAGDVLAPSGMRFGRFEPSELALPFWGRLELRFSDCTHASLSYDSNLPGYGQGEIALTRLLPPEASCSLEAPAGLATMAGQWATGSITGNYPMLGGGQSPINYVGGIEGFVTREGGLALAGDSPAPLPSYVDFVLIGTPQPAAAGEAHLRVRVYSNGWLNPETGLGSAPAQPSPDHDQFALRLQTLPHRAKGLLLPHIFGPGAPDADFRVYTSRRGEGSLRAGIYPFSIDSPASDQRRSLQLEVASDRSLCVRDLTTPTRACIYVGQAQEGAEHFAFVLSRVGRDDLPAFTGVGQLHYCRQLICTSFLHMIGDNGRTGLTLYTESVPR